MEYSRDKSGRFLKGKYYKNGFKEGNTLWKLRKNIKDKSIMIECACGCGLLRSKYNSQGREKKYISGHFVKSKEHKENHAKWMKERIVSKETRKKMRNNKLGEKNNFYNWKAPDDIIKARSKKLKELWKNEEYAKIFIKNTLRNLEIRPTSFEKRIILLCSKYNLPFVYTGDGRILIGYKNPDFINKKDKIIIEVFLNYFKIRDYGSVENYIKKRGEHFAKFGYKTIFIREEEITDKNWEEICLNKIKD